MVVSFNLRFESSARVAPHRRPVLVEITAAPWRDGYRCPKRQSKPIFTISGLSLQHRHFFDSLIERAVRAFTPRSSRTLNCPSNFSGHDDPNKPANGKRTTTRSCAGITGRLTVDRGRARGRAATKKETGMFQGHFGLDTATPVEATAIPDVLFERGLYWASGRSGVVNLVAAHKWFNLAALKGRPDAISMRREVAEMMSDAEIATAQREARAWMTTH
jgi:uncharacterized protein